MATVGISYSVLFLLMFGGGGGLPLGVPPLPEDPVLARVAPADCLAYTSWSGTAAPNAASKNQTEQLLAEPEIQDMFRQIGKAIGAVVEKNGPQEQEMVTRRRDALRWAKAALARPVALFVSSVDIKKDSPDIRGGLVMNAGDDAAELKAALEKFQSFLPQAAEKVEVGGISGYRLAVAPGAPSITWGFKDKYLLVGVGEGSLESMLQRMNGAVPEWMNTLRKQLPVERLSTVTYINVKKLVEQFGPLGGAKLQLVIDAAGLGNVTTLSAVSGLDGEGFVNRSLLGVQGEPAGVLSLAVGKPLAAKDLAAIPGDASFASVGRLDLTRLMDTLLATVEKVEPQAKEEIQHNLDSMKEQLGVDLRKDIVDSLGDLWCVYNSPGEGGLVITGLTAVVQVKDFDRLSAAQTKLLALAEKAIGPKNQPVRPDAQVEKVRFLDQDIYFFSANEMPFAPSWCLTKKELIVAAFPQQIKAYLSRGADFKSLATVPEVAEALAIGNGPMSLSYVDTRRTLDYIYPMVCIGVQMVGRELAREGIDVNLSMIPSAPAIYKHLRPSIGFMRRTDAGIEFTSRGTLPSAGFGATLPLAAGFFLPLVRAMPAAGMPMNIVPAQ